MRLSKTGAESLDEGVRHRRKRRKIFLGHADEFVFLSIADDLNPVILEQLDLDLAFGQQAHEFQKFLRRDGAGAFFFDLGFAGRADAQLKVGRRDGDAAALGFDQKIGKNRDCRLALHDTLRGAEFVQQRGLCYAEFHGLVFLACGSCCGHSAFPRRCPPLAYSTRFSGKYKVHKGRETVEMRRAEDFVAVA